MIIHALKSSSGRRGFRGLRLLFLGLSPFTKISNILIPQLSYFFLMLKYLSHKKQSAIVFVKIWAWFGANESFYVGMKFHCLVMNWLNLWFLLYFCIGFVWFLTASNNQFEIISKFHRLITCIFILNLKTPAKNY